MRKETCSRRGQRGNVLLMVTFSLPLILGLTGLAIDGTMCYIVQAELSAAVDGAALGTGRMLSAITTDDQAKDIAQAFMNADFRVGVAGFWGAQFNGTPTVLAAATTADITKTVQISATANVPLLFMNFIHQSKATVGANGTATRRDARIEVVIDRSGSMSGVLPTLLSAAHDFTNGFTGMSGTVVNDEMGLIVFSNGGVVAYPRTTAPPYNPALPVSGACSPCGPDGYFKDGTAHDMLHEINSVVVQNNTNMGDALAMAYTELQKAHVRDILLSPTGVDTRQNYIVLFTDGVPNTISVYLNNPGDPRNDPPPNPGSPMYVLAPQATTGCSAASRIDTGGFPIKGVIEANQTSSFYQIASLDPTHTSDAYVTASAASSPDKQVASTPNFLSYGCTQSKFQNLTALQSIPSMDANGYNLGPNTETGNPGYQYSSYSGQCCSTPNIYTAPNQWLAYPSPATPINTGYPNQYGAAYQWQLAAWDAVDNVASAIRSDANHTARGEVLNPDGTPPMGVTIFTVGYTGDGGTDAGLLSKVANVAGCSFNSMSCVVATGPNGAKEGNGKYIEATTTTELTTAFSTLMSTILRLSQ